MKIPPPNEGKPIYQHIMEYIIGRIDSGVLPPGYKLPTVRAFAAENNVAQGTVKHAYDLLEQQGFLEKAQGRGTFVRDRQTGKAGKKEQAMEAIDGFLDRMAGLDFSPEETRIYLDLKLREREGDISPVRLGAVDCCPEAVGVMARQITGLGHVDVREFLLPAVLDAPGNFDPGLDILVTTATHYEQVEAKKAAGLRLARLVMAISPRTLLELSRIPEGSRAVIVCASERFAQIIMSSYQNYDVLQTPPAVAYFGQADLEEQLHQAEQLILPPGYWRFATPEEQQLIQNIQYASPPILFDYRVEQGSLLYLEEQIEELYRAKLPKI